MNFSERLKELRKESGITQVELAKKIGLASQGAYRQYETGTSKPQAERLQNLANIFNVSVSYLLGETDVRSNSLNETIEQLNETNQEKVLVFAQELLSKQNNIITIDNHRKLHKVKVQSQQHLSAGCGASYTDEINFDTVLTDSYTPHDLAVWIEGDSMEPDFPNWDVALIKVQTTIDYEGQICAVDDVENGQAYIKCVSIEGDYLRLESLNKSVDKYGNLKYPDILLPRSANPRIIGKVIDNFTPIEE